MITYDPRIGRFITKDPLTWGPDDPRVLSTPNQPEPFKGIISQNRGVLNPDTIMNAFNPFERQELRKAIIFDIGKEVPGLFNRYVYCFNNPILFIDPWGLVGPTAAIISATGGTLVVIGLATGNPYATGIGIGLTAIGGALTIYDYATTPIEQIEKGMQRLEPIRQDLEEMQKLFDDHAEKSHF